MTKCVLSWLAGLCLFLSPMLLDAQCVSTTVSSPDGSNPIVTCEGDGNPDVVNFNNSGAAGSSYAYAITDSDFNILMIVTDDSFDFEGSGIGNCQVWGFSYDGDIIAMAGDFVFSTQFATNCWLISQNAIQVSRTSVQGGAVSLTNGDTQGFACVGDGFPDILSFSSTGDGSVSYVVTDGDGTIISIGNSPNIDFDGNDEGDFQVYAVSSTGNITAMVGDNISGIAFSDDCFQVSENFVSVSASTIDAGTITTDDGLGYVQIADSTDNQSFTLINTSTSNADYAYVLTDNTFNILQILPNNVVDMSSYDAGKYFVWAYSYTGDIIAQIGDSVFSYPFSTGCSQISITAVVIEKFFDGPGTGEPVCLANAGTLTIDADPVTLVDGTATISAMSDGNANVPADYETIFVLTSNGVILQTGTSPSFDVTMAGDYIIHTLIAETSDNTDDDFLDLSGVVLGTTTVSEILPSINAVCADLDANGAPVTVNEDVVDPCDDFNGGMVMMPNGNTVRYTCPGDGNPDIVMLDSTDVVGDNFTYIVTDGMGTVLAIPTGDMVDVEGAGEGNCRIYGLAYSGNLTIAVDGDINSDLSDDCFDLSDNFVLTIREIPDGGSLTTADGETEITICSAGDGTPDVIDFTAVDTVGQNFTYVVTDSEGVVLGIPSGNSVDFDPAGTGTCYVYGLSYTGDLNLQMGDTLSPPNNDPNANGGNVSPVYNEMYGGLSGIYLSDSGDISEIFASSNTQSKAGIFGVNGDDTFTLDTFDVEALDADGIYYDADADVVYQLNRTDNVVNAYSDINGTPTLTATSTSDFTNGREIAVSGDLLVVAQDADASNGDQNSLLVYQITPTAITLMNEYDVDINLWGIHADGSTLYAVVDNSNNVAVFENFFGQPDGMIAPTNTVSVEGIVRTHGLTYDAGADIMVLTDVGSGMVDDDGAFVVVYNFTDAIADGNVSAAEQVRVEGADTFLGNPVDVAIDLDNDRVYIAERANGGGRLLSFELPDQNPGVGTSSDVATDCFDFSDEFVTVNRFNVDGGMVTLTNGAADTTIVIDGNPDILTFVSTGATGDDFAFVVTDTNGVILAFPPSDTIDFEQSGVGVCYVWGLAYTGDVTAMVGDTATVVDLADGCFALSEQFVTVTRNEDNPTGVTEAQFFVSSNTQDVVGVFNILDNGGIAQDSFPSVALDADGIYYDLNEDVIYQLNRTSNVVNAYDNVNANLAVDLDPAVTAASTSDFTNGREIAVSFGRLVVAQDADASNGDQNAFVVYDISATAITLTNTYQVPHNTWGIQADGEDLYAVADNSDSVAFYQNFFDNMDGAITPTAYVKVDGIVRTHGLTYLAEEDIMVLTDVGSGMVDDDGAFVMISNWTAASADGTVTMEEQIRVAGESSLLGNPVDIAVDIDRNMVYVAERLNGGGRVLGFDVPTMSGDAVPTYNELFAGASAIHIGTDMTPDFPNLLSKFFVSSNTQSIISGIDVFEDGTIEIDSFDSAASDADGIYYDSVLDNLYQLNRIDNVINKYDDVVTSLIDDIDPVVSQTSTSDFINGREISVSDNRLVVAQDASADNGMQNRLLVYDIAGTDITLLNTYDVDINLWGIQAVGEDLIAVIDNSDSVAIFLNFFANADGLVDYTAAIQIEGIVRTHGLTFDAEEDIMILTDVGSGMVDDDGAIVIIDDFFNNAADGIISVDEQIRIEGAATLLGNPVDVALDLEDGIIYVAERLNGGGRILGYDMLSMGGNIAPTYDIPYPGVSAIFMTDIDVVPAQVMNEDIPFANLLTTETVAVKFSVFPNPASDNLNLVWEQSDNAVSTEVTINLVDLQGRVISSRQEGVTNGINTFQMEVMELQTGLYTIIMANKDGVKTQRFMKK